LSEETNKNSQYSSRIIYVFDAFVERYDVWFNPLMEKSAFKLEKSCIALLCRNLKRPSLEIGAGTLLHEEGRGRRRLLQKREALQSQWAGSNDEEKRINNHRNMLDTFPKTS
jgi:hypothetical protein